MQRPFLVGARIGLLSGFGVLTGTRISPHVQRKCRSNTRAITCIGHILLRVPSEDKSNIRFGFVIVDDSKRGKGYGKQMLRLAIGYAQQELGAQKITLGVFCDNHSALKCYKSIGFCITGEGYYMIDGEEWKEYEMHYKAL